MGSSPDRPPWWDREVDESGNAIRTDVREAARRIWGTVCARVRSILGDSSEAPELLEKVVASVSRSLDRNNVAPHDPSGLLIVEVRRSAQRLAGRRRREPAVGGTSELAESLNAPDWSDAVDRRIFLERLVRALEEPNRAILRLRVVGYDWSEIGEILKVEPAVARKAFWKDVRRAQSQLLKPDRSDTSGAEKE